MTTANSQPTTSWEPQPAASRLIDGYLAAFQAELPPLDQLARDLHTRTGTRLRDWVDHLLLPADPGVRQTLREAGFKAIGQTRRRAPSTGGEASRDDGLTAGSELYWHPGALLPRVALRGGTVRALALRVESIVDFLSAIDWPARGRIEGPPGSAVRRVQLAENAGMMLSAVEQHGSMQLGPDAAAPAADEALRRHEEAFRLRRRTFADDRAAFDHADALLRDAIDELGAGRACDLFFAAEREYWQRRNRAAQIQFARQQALGLGWANHDHHTYRSSRALFHRLIATLERLGFACRERFYAGHEAGWGAQVLEHPDAQIVVFADVDLAPDEVTGDFAHQPLPPRASLGTVGLWCRLHGEAFLQAGMHHLECQFDFDAAREQLAAAGVRTMPPFTDLPYLRQAFTEGEHWPVAPERIDALLADGTISPAQAEPFRSQGAVGSHLEILERRDGYKGFNQAGINDIIRDTDPRRAAQA